ncbi:MAG: HlyD family efflux transporter periplasmic adaptor subunit [Planctomycetota bacterium]
MLKRVVWVFVLLLLCVAVGIIYVSSRRENAQDTHSVQFGVIERMARGSGRIEGLGEPTNLSFGVSGYLEKVNVKEGQEIDPDDSVVAELSPSELNVKIAQAEASLKQAMARLELVKAPRPPEVIKQAEEKLRQVAEEVKAAESRLKALQEPPFPAPGQLHEIAEAARNVERAQQKLNLEKSELEKLNSRPTDDDRMVWESIVSLAHARLNGAQRLLEDKENTSVITLGFSGPTKTQKKIEVELAQEELQKAKAERDKATRRASPPELAAAEARVKLAKTEVESAVAAKELLEKPVKPKPSSEYVIAEANYVLEQTKARQGQEEAVLKQLKRGHETAEVAVAEAAKEEAEKSVALLKTYREGLKLRAPFSGLITKRYVEPGVLVPAFSPIITLVDFSRKLVRAEFDSARLAEIKKGMKVTLSSKAFKETLDGKVERIVSVGTRKILIDDPSATKGGEVVEALISVEEPRSDLKKNAFATLLPGLRMDASITLERKENVLRIPKSFVANDGKEYVLLKNSAAGAEEKKREVKCGLRDEQYVEIIHGLEEGNIITKPEPLHRR